MNSRWVRGWSPDKGEPRPPLSIISLSKGFFSLLSPSLSPWLNRLIWQSTNCASLYDPWHIKPSKPNHICTLGGPFIPLPGRSNHPHSIPCLTLFRTLDSLPYLIPITRFPALPYSDHLIPCLTLFRSLDSSPYLNCWICLFGRLLLIKTLITFFALFYLIPCGDHVSSFAWDVCTGTSPGLRRYVVRFL